MTDENPAAETEPPPQHHHAGDVRLAATRREYQAWRDERSRFA